MSSLSWLGGSILRRRRSLDLHPTAFLPKLALGILPVLVWAGEESAPPRGAGPTASSTFRLEAPLSIPRASFFHAALEIPPLETARTLEPGGVLVALETAHVRSVERRRIDGVESRFDGLFHDWGTLKLAFGVAQRVELFGRASLSGWDEKLDKFFLLDRAGNPIVENEAGVVFGGSASHRHDNVSDAVLGLKGLFVRRESAGFDLSALGSVKIPVARATDLTHAGTYDLNFALLTSVPLGDFTLHASGGIGLPLGKQSIFVPEANVDLRAFVYGGVGVAWRLPGDFAVIAQAEVNSSAFEHVRFLEGPPLTTEVGVRKQWGAFIVELGGGTGLLPRSSYDYAIHFEISWLYDLFTGRSSEPREAPASTAGL